MSDPHAPTCCLLRGAQSLTRGSQLKGAARGHVHSRVQWEQRSSSRGTAWLHQEGRAAHHCLPGLMLVFPMPEKLPPPRPLLLALGHLLTTWQPPQGLPQTPMRQCWGYPAEGLCCGFVWDPSPASCSGNKVPPAQLSIWGA